MSAVIPQQGIAEDQIVDWRVLLGRAYVVVEELWLDRIYTSPLFLGVVGLLCVNLAAGNVVRIRRLRQTRAFRTQVRLAGSILFHLALLVIMAGAAVNHLYHFRVVFGLTEGQQVRDDPRDYFREFSGPLCHAQKGRFTLSLERAHTSWPVGEAMTEAAEINVTGTGGVTSAAGVIRVNHPMRWDGLEFHLGSQIGYSPELLVTNNEGKELFRSFVRLARRPGNGGLVDADYVFLSEDSTRVGLKTVAGSGTDERASILVTVERDGRQLYSGQPGPAGTRLPDGRLIAVPRIRRWCYVEVVQNPLINAIFTGFWIALGGLVVTAVPRLVPVRRKPS